MMRSSNRRKLKVVMLLLFCLFLTAISTRLFAQNSEDNAPLTPAELRQVLLRLYDCNSCEEQLSIYEKYVGEEKNMCAELLTAERKNTELTAKDRDIALKEAALYKSLYESIKKKKAGFGCWMGRIFTGGIYQCPK